MCDARVMAAAGAAALSRRQALGAALAGGAALLGAALGGCSSASLVPEDGGRAAPPRRLRHVRDLTHVLHPGFPTFSGEPALLAETTTTVAEHGYFGLTLRYYEHSGTHMDAPVHFDPRGASVERLPPAELVVPAAVVDISARAARDPDTALEVDDLLAWERRHGRLPPRACVLVHTGWAARAADPAAFRNPDASGRLHFPGIAPEAARWLLAERTVTGLGVDTLSLDPGRSTAFETHQIWLGAGRWGLENVAGLDEVPPCGAWLFVGAPRVAGGSGGPCRLLALW
ncbi:MAG: cyclase [Planctomycetota bacterium]|nr:MAG: cyclase [Planctomycetota bacterium]